MKKVLALAFALSLGIGIASQPSSVFAKSYVYKYGTYYNNEYNIKVRRPNYYQSVPSGANAICSDGTYSFSLHARGTCSHHSGVSNWLK